MLSVILYILGAVNMLFLMVLGEDLGTPSSTQAKVMVSITWPLAAFLIGLAGLSVLIAPRVEKILKKC